MDEIEYKIKSELFDKSFSSFTMKKNNTYFLIGENGIGKTTLLQKITSYFRKNEKLNYDINYDIFISKKEIFRTYKKVDINKKELLKKINELGDINMRNISSDENYISNNKIEELNTFIMDMIQKNNREYIDKISTQRKKLINEIIDILRENRKKVIKSLDCNKFSLYDLIKNGHKTSFINRDYINDIYKEIKDDFLDDLIKYYGIDINHINLNLYGVDKFEIFVISDSNDENILRIKNNLQKIKKLNKEFHQILYQGNEHIFLPSIDRLIWKVNLKMSKLEYFNNEYSFNNNSTGEKVIEWLKNIKEEHIKQNFIVGMAFDEPFNHLDYKRSKEAIEIIDQIPGTKLIATHSAKAIKYSKFENLILMWKNDKNKYCISNVSNLKKLESNKNNIYEFIASILSETIMEKTSLNKKILIVEGYFDLVILKKYFSDDEYSIWPVGGVPYIQLAINFAERISKNIRILMDNDEAGINQEAKIKQYYDPSIFIRKKIFGNNKTFLERLISKNNDNKYKIRNDIKNGKYDKRIEDISNQIKKTF